MLLKIFVDLAPLTTRDLTVTAPGEGVSGSQAGGPCSLSPSVFWRHLPHPITTQ